MFSLVGPKAGGLIPASITGAMGVALAAAFLFFGMRGRDLGLVALYLFLSGTFSLAFGLGAFHLGVKSAVSIRYKIALAGAAGGLVALVNVMVTALLMFLSWHDLTLLLVLLLFSLIVSSFFTFVLARSITSSIEKLTRGGAVFGQGRPIGKAGGWI